jgi:hypothetical protein
MRQITRSRDVFGDEYLLDMSERDLEVSDQPEEVVRAVAGLLPEGSSGEPGPWWRAGIAEATAEDD